MIFLLPEVLSNSGHFSSAWGLTSFSKLPSFSYIFLELSQRSRSVCRKCIKDYPWSLSLVEKGGSSNAPKESGSVMLLQILWGVTVKVSPDSTDCSGAVMALQSCPETSTGCSYLPHCPIAHWTQAALKIRWDLGPGD